LRFFHKKVGTRASRVHHNLRRDNYFCQEETSRVLGTGYDSHGNYFYK